VKNNDVLFNHCLQLPAWCPACGEKKLQAVSKKSLQCVSCNFIYYHNVAATSSAIIETENQFLMVQRAHDPCREMLDLPGGFIEKHETAELALRRELHEELGITIEQEIKYLCNFTNTYHYAGIDYYTMDLYFRIYFDSLPKITGNDEVSGFEWLDVNEIPESRIGFDSVKNACHFYRQHKSGS